MALESSGRLTGVAAWVPPDGVATSRPSRWLARLASLEVRALFPRATPRLLAGFSALGENHPPESHWYLAFVGIEPGQQQRGMGRSPLAPIIERADHAGISCFSRRLFLPDGSRPAIRGSR